MSNEELASPIRVRLPLPFVVVGLIAYCILVSMVAAAVWGLLVMRRLTFSGTPQLVLMHSLLALPYMAVGALTGWSAARILGPRLNARLLTFLCFAAGGYYLLVHRVPWYWNLFDSTLFLVFSVVIGACVCIGGSSSVRARTVSAVSAGFRRLRGRGHDV